MPTVLVTLLLSVCRLCMAQQSNQTLRAKKKKYKKMLSSSAGLGLVFQNLTQKLATSTSANLDVNENISLKNFAITLYKNAPRSYTLTPQTIFLSHTVSFVKSSLCRIYQCEDHLLLLSGPVANDKCQLLCVYLAGYLR